RHTRFSLDWSSDVCSSDLVYYKTPDSKRNSWKDVAWLIVRDAAPVDRELCQHGDGGQQVRDVKVLLGLMGEVDVAGTVSCGRDRSEERRVGKEDGCRRAA